MDSEKGWTLLFWAMIVLGVLAVLFRGGDIEQDLADRANAALHESGLPWASVKEVNGRNLILTGEAPVMAQREWPVSIVENLYGVRKVDDAGISVKPPVTPYIWAAIVTPDKVTLTGFVPDEDTRAAILEKVGNIVSDRAITDKMVLADGAPDNSWLENINNVLKYTKYLKNGAVHLNDRSVKVEGEAWNSLDFEVIALRSSRGRTVNEYSFSSDLVPPEDSAGQSLVTIAPNPVEGKEAKTAEKTVKHEDNAEADAKTADADMAPVAAKPGVEVKTAGPKNGGDAGAPDEKSSAALAPSPGTATATDDVSGKVKAVSAESVKTDAPEAEAVEKSSGDNLAQDKAEKPGKAVSKAGGKAETKIADEEKPAVAKAAMPQSSRQKRSAGPARIPAYMIAPPWALAPYRAPPARFYPPSRGYYPAPRGYYPAPPAYYPNCGYGYPYAPAYCGRPAY